MGRRILNDLKKNIIPIGCCLFTIVVLRIVFGTVCLVKLISGIPCPACGMTRAGIALLHFDFSRALYYHPMIPFVAIGMVLFVLKKYILVNDCKWMKYYVIIFTVGVFTVYIYRFSTMYPDIPPMDFNNDNFICFLKNFFN